MDRDPGAWPAVGRHGPRRHAGAADHRDAVCLPRASHEPGRHLWCARRCHDGRRSRDRMLRDCREPDAGARRRRALRGRKRCLDRTRPDHRCLHLCWLSICSGRKIEGVINMFRQSFRSLVAALLLLLASLITPSRADDQAASHRIQEEIWALPLPLPMFAYLVRPVGDGPFPLVILHHGVSMNPTGRSFFPLVEFRDAAKWFAQRGYLVVAPVGSRYGASAIDIPEHGIYGPFFSKVVKASNPNFRAPGLAVAQVDLWIIDYLTAEKRIVPKDVIVVGQSAGEWASIPLPRPNPPHAKPTLPFPPTPPPPSA